MQRKNRRITSTILVALLALIAIPAMAADRIKFVVEVTNASKRTIQCVGRLNDVTDVVWRKTLKPGESMTKSAAFIPNGDQRFGEFGLEIDKANGSPQLLCGLVAWLKGTPGNYEITSIEPDHCMFRPGNYTYSHEGGTAHIKYTFKGLD